MKRGSRIVLSIVFAITAVASVRELHAAPGGCCATQDCGVIGQPYTPCSPPNGAQNSTCSAVHPNQQYCCDFGGWCG